VKRKKATASTGHRTGVMQERPMRHRLATPRRRLRILASFRRGLHDQRGRSVPNKKLDFHRTTRKGPDPWALREMWQQLFPKPKHEDTGPGGYDGPSIADRLQECGTAREAAKFLREHGAAGASASTQRKWARIVERKLEAEVAA
jgi:hypothetical protein